MQQVIPQACAQFHDALDRMEDELSRAKTIMRRDFAVYQAIRAKRLAEEAAENERLTAVESATDVVLTGNESEAAKNVAPQAAGNGGGGTEMQDVAQVVRRAEQATVAAAGDSATSTSKIPAKGVEEPPSTKDAPKASDAGFKPSMAAHTMPTMTPVKSPSTAGDFQDLDFHSMFEDLPGDVGTDGIVTADKSVDLNTFSDANADDVSSLLPGLETYANIQPTPVESNNVASTLDLSMLDVPDQASAANTEQKPKAAEKTEPQPQESAGLGDFTGDSTFDDLFNYEFEVGGTGEDREGGNNDGGEFEDAWMSGFGNDG
jgi:hypothetical protein